MSTQYAQPLVALTASAMISPGPAESAGDVRHDEAIVEVAARHRLHATAPAWYVDQVVGDVQQYFHDTFVDTTWPACPRHPLRHPLRAVRARRELSEPRRPRRRPLGPARGSRGPAEHREPRSRERAPRRSSALSIREAPFADRCDPASGARTHPTVARGTAARDTRSDPYGSRRASRCSIAGSTSRTWPTRRSG